MDGKAITETRARGNYQLYKRGESVILRKGTAAHGRDRRKGETKMETAQKDRKKAVLSVAALAAVIVILFCVYQFTKGKTAEGQKTVTIEVVHGDGHSNAFEVTTAQEYLGEVLKEEGIAEGEDGAYGMYILTADGETADESSQEWWCITKGGEQLNTSADQTPLQDGDKYELTLTVGY